MNRLKELLIPEHDSKVAHEKITFPETRCTGLLTIDYLSEEMLSAMQSRSHLAAIITASTLVEVSLRYYLVLADALTSGTHPTDLLPKWKGVLFYELIKEAGRRGVDQENISHLHDFRKTIRNHFVHGGLSAYDHLFSGEDQHDDVSADGDDEDDEEGFNKLLAFVFLGPMELIMRAEADALFAVVFAFKLATVTIPWKELLEQIGLPNLSTEDVTIYSRTDGGAEISGPREILVSRQAFEQLNEKWWVS